MAARRNSAVFADTFYYFAFLNPRDELHEGAVAFTESFNGKMITTTWVLTELADGLADPIDRNAFCRFYNSIKADAQIEIVPASHALWEAGLARYKARDDKEWSLTDCISFVVMERKRLTDAVTGDHHFEQAGFKALLK